MHVLVHQKKTVTVPNLIGKSIHDALDLLAPLNLSLQKVNEQYDKKFPAGTIIQQNPSPGLTVREGKTISIVLSRGGEIVFVPNLVGESLRSAELLLRRNNLVLGEIAHVYSFTLEKGKVVAQDPGPDAVVAKGNLVNLSLSLGTPPPGTILMPNFLNKNVSEAALWAQEKGLIIKEIEEDPNSPLERGTIIKQIPPPDLVVNPGNELKFTVSGKIKETLKKLYWLHYEIPQGVEEKNIRILLEDSSGERMVYEKLHLPGTKIDLPLSIQDKGKIKIFSNNILVEERILE